MNVMNRDTGPVVGRDVPAAVGMALEDVGTPALIVDLDAFEKNVETMRAFVAKHGLRLRAHAVIESYFLAGGTHLGSLILPSAKAAGNTITRFPSSVHWATHPVAVFVGSSP